MARRYLTLALLGYLLFIAVASLAQGIETFSLERGWHGLRTFWVQAPHVTLHGHDLRDITTNILLYLPLGALVAARRLPGRLRNSTLALSFGTLVSLAMESAQAFTRRSSDPVDVLTNTGGYLFGLLLVTRLQRRHGFRGAMLFGLSGEEAFRRHGMVEGVFFAYGAIFFLVQLLPLDLTVSLGDIHRELLAGPGRSGRIILDPAALWLEPGAWGHAMSAFLGFLPLAVLYALRSRSRGRSPLPSALWGCTRFSVLIELMQVFVMSRTSATYEVVSAAMAGLVGGTVVRLVAGRRDTAGGAWSREWLPLLMLAYLLFLCLVYWFPYRFDPDLGVVARKLREETIWIPFQAHFAVRNLHSALDIVEQFLLYLPLGFLLRLLPWRQGTGLRIPLAMGAVLVVALLLELSQGFCVGRVVDVTDILLAVAGAGFGMALARILSQSALGDEV